MVIKLTPFEIAHPDSDLHKNEGHSSLFAHAGAEFLTLCMYIHANASSKVYFYAELPLLHQSIELLLKAHAAKVDTSFSAKKYGHDTVKIINDYAGRIPVFSELAGNNAAIYLINGLKEAWLSVRYAEVMVESSGLDSDDAIGIGKLLANDYCKSYGIQILAQH